MSSWVTSIDSITWTIKRPLQKGYMASTTVSTHCHCCNFLVSLQFVHRIYQRWKFSAGARRKPVWKILWHRYKLYVLSTCNFELQDHHETYYCFPKMTTHSFIFPWSTICPPSLTRSTCLLSRPIGLHALAPSMGIILKLPLSMLVYRQFQNILF